MKVLGDSRLSRKFQVTIPKRVRNILRLDAGDLLVFVAEGKHIVLKPGRVKIEDRELSDRKVIEVYSK